MSTSSFCPNCYHPSPGDYCPQCGQKQAERREGVRGLAREFIDEQFGVNRRLPRTLGTLLFKPGVLTTEYFNGRVQQYIAPFRLYLLTSVVFFALSSITQKSPLTIETTDDDVRESTTARPGTEDQGDFVGFRMPAHTTGNWLRDVEVNFLFDPLSRAAERNLRDLSTLGQTRGTQELMRTVIAQMPKVFFAFLPIYALLLFIFFRQQRKYYVEHFVLGMHLHAFAFMALIPVLVLDLPFLPQALSVAGDSLAMPVFIWIVVYIFIALRRVYGQSRLVTGVKYFFLWILYIAQFSLGVLVAAVLALTRG